MRSDLPNYRLLTFSAIYLEIVKVFVVSWNVIGCDLRIHKVGDTFLYYTYILNRGVGNHLVTVYQWMNDFLLEISRGTCPDSVVSELTYLCIKIHKQEWNICTDVKLCSLNAKDRLVEQKRVNSQCSGTLVLIHRHNRQPDSFWIQKQCANLHTN